MDGFSPLLSRTHHTAELPSGFSCYVTSPSLLTILTVQQIHNNDTRKEKSVQLPSSFPKKVEITLLQRYQLFTTGVWCLVVFLSFLDLSFVISYVGSYVSYMAHMLLLLHLPLKTSVLS